MCILIQRRVWAVLIVKNLRLIEIFNQYFSNKYEINYIVSNLDQKTLLEKKGEKVLYLKKNFWFKIEQFLFRFSFLKKYIKNFHLIINLKMN